MTLDELRAAAAAADSALADHAPYLESIARPVVFLHSHVDAPALGASKLGGWPDLPADVPWPSHHGGPYAFLGQIRFEELPDGTALLPRCGLLLLFAGTQPEEALFWGDPGYVRAIYVPRPEGLVTTAPAAPTLVSEVCWSLRFELGVHLPQSIDQRTDWPVEPHGDRDALCAFTTMLRELAGEDPSPDHLLGYPAQSSLAYDPTPGPEWRHLLTLSSHDALGWCWHDGDPLHVAIEHSRLASADFSNLASDAG